MNKVLVDELICKLKDEGYPVNIPDSRTNISSQPWFISSIIGISAWISAVLIIIFIGSISHELFSSSAALITVGLLLCAGSIAVHSFPERNIFMSQFSLAFFIAGEILNIAGFFNLNGSESFKIFLLIVFELLILWVFNNSFHRLISTAVIAGSLYFLSEKSGLKDFTHIITFLLAFIFIKLWEKKAEIMTGALKNYFNPVVFGLAVSMICIFTLPLYNRTGLGFVFGNWMFSSISLIIVLIFTANDILETDVKASKKNKTIILLSLFLIMLTALKSPGIVASFLLLTAAFRFRSIILFTIANISLIFFIIFFYYNLNITLLEKSIILITSGIALLIARKLLNRFSGART